MWHDTNGWWVVWGTVMMLLFSGGIIALTVWTMRSFTERGDSSLEIARQRYARGEIGREEFEKIERDLVTEPR